MTGEDGSEGVGILGFLGMGMFRALQGDLPRYFSLCELETPDVVGGAAYLARLNSPTLWSQRIMPQLQNFIRGGGSVAAASGAGAGRVRFGTSVRRYRGAERRGAGYGPGARRA